MRLFTALELPDNVRAKLDRIARRIVAGAMDLKYVHSENLHVTLKFLGEVKESRVGEVTRALRDLTTEAVGELFADRAELLPPRGPVRVVAVGLAGDTGGLRRLFRAVEECCVEFDVPAERRDFRGHVTLARARNPLHPSSRQHLSDIIAADLPGLFFAPAHFTLFKSELKSTGPEYTPVERFPFAVL